MTPAAMALVAEFEARRQDGAGRRGGAAQADGRAESGALERQRAFAFRRTRLIRTLATRGRRGVGARAGLGRAASGGARRARLDRESDVYEAILVRLQPVALAVWKCACAVDSEAPPAVVPELEAFEAWFEGAHGKSFYALFDQYVSEVPVVDF